MHMKGEPRTMQDDPRYDDVVSEVESFLEQRLAFAVGRGIAEERIWLDPGIGFGKSLEHNLELLRRLDEIVALGRPVLVGRLAEALHRRARRGGRSASGWRQPGRRRAGHRAWRGDAEGARGGAHPGCHCWWPVLPWSRTGPGSDIELRGRN